MKKLLYYTQRFGAVRLDLVREDDWNGPVIACTATMQPLTGPSAVVASDLASVHRDIDKAIDFLKQSSGGAK